MQAVIMAGGKGVRLKPFTACIPKPLMPIDEIPILEIVLMQLKHYGFNRIILSVNYLSELIMAYFKNGERLGLDIKYSIENEPLGTAGPLSLVAGELESNFLVMNADLLTNINYGQLFSFHIGNGNAATIGVYSKEIKIDLGVVRSEDSEFLDYIEKPVFNFDVSMGIYAFHKSALDCIPYNERMDIPQLIHQLKAKKQQIRCQKMDCTWIDIGKFEDFEKASSLFKAKRGEFLPYEKSIVSRL